LNINQLTGTIPGSIGKLSLLNQLYVLASTGLCFIINERDCTDLLHIAHRRNLSKNQLTGPIPDTIGNLSKIVYMYASQVVNHHCSRCQVLTVSTRTDISTTTNSPARSLPRLEMRQSSSCMLHTSTNHAVVRRCTRSGSHLVLQITTEQPTVRIDSVFNTKQFATQPPVCKLSHVSQ
jgi:hypothetical protein